ncbi:MAG: hypothetical protein IKR19_07630 [Acholeplasmatales bacterium]|nr:hypothetical protein [Acholeplasmatales bacterium]
MERIRPLYPLRKISNINEIYHPQILNLFSDASTRNTGHSVAAAYSVVAVTMDNILESVERVHTDTDSAEEELRGVRSALLTACRYRNMFPYINIFSDNLNAIHDVRKYPSYWVFNQESQTYYTVSRKPVKNMNLIGECLMILEDLMRTNIVNIYHIKGHVAIDGSSASYKQLKLAASTFQRENNIPDYLKIDLNLIRYCCAYNGVVDGLSRSLLYRTDVFTNQYRDAVEFSLDHDIFFDQSQLNCTYPA